MALLVRTWNVFHGNAQPPERRGFLEQMVRLASADRPDVLCLQEVPAWALPRLAEWSRMTVVGDLSFRALLGSAELGRTLTAVNHGLFRSAFSGQGNAILLAPALQPLAHSALVLNERAFRRRTAARLGLGARARLAWGKERRICQAVRAALPGGAAVLVVNLHATSYPPDLRLADAELKRAAAFADGLAQPGELCVLAGDFNLSPSSSCTLAELAGPDWGFSAPEPNIDQVLVRGAEVGPAERWADERRRLDGRLLSDHAPVEVRIG